MLKRRISTIASLVLAGVVAASCGSSAAPTTNAQPEQVDAGACSGSDPSPGLDLAVEWTVAEERDLIVQASSSGAGVALDISAVVATSPISVTTDAVDASETSLRWSVGETEFEGGGASADDISSVTADISVDSSGAVVSVEGIDDDAAAERVTADVELYQFVTSIGEGETQTENTTAFNPLTDATEDATLTIEHLGLYEDGCEIVRVTNHIGPQAVIDNLDDLLDDLRDPNRWVAAFNDSTFEGSVVRTTTYRFDHAIERIRSVEFTEAWGIRGAGSVDTQITTRTITDVSDR